MFIEHDGDFVVVVAQVRRLKLRKELVVGGWAEVAEGVHAGALDRLARGVED